MTSGRSEQAEVEHYGRIARLLNGPRRQVLELLDQHGPMALEDLLAHWPEQGPDELTRHAVHRRRMVSSALWKLEALGFVVDHSGKLSLSFDGRSALREDSLSKC